MGARFNPAPGWPAAPPGWLPPPGWQPDPSWPAPPPGWVFITRTGPPRAVVGIGTSLVIGMVGFGWALVRGDLASEQAPAVGECAHVVGADDLTRVDCADPTADLQVTRRVDDTTDGDRACASDPAATSYYVYDSQANQGSVVSFVLCLAPR